MQTLIDNKIQNKLEYITSYPDLDRIIWLNTQQWYTQEHEELNTKLTEIAPKTQILAHPHHHIPIKFILDAGQIVNIRVLQYDMENSRCHDNCDKLYLRNEIANVYTGFALSSDGLWRYHSWGYDSDDSGYIVETTEERLLYFGVKIYEDKNA